MLQDLDHITARIGQLAERTRLLKAERDALRCLRGYGVPMTLIGRRPDGVNDIAGLSALLAGLQEDLAP